MVEQARFKLITGLPLPLGSDRLWHLLALKWGQGRGPEGRGLEGRRR